MSINSNVPGISIALIISFAGLVLMSYFNWVALLISGHTMDAAVWITVAFSLVAAFGMTAAIMGKQANTDFSIWRRLRYVGLAIMVAATAFTCYNATAGINFMIFDRARLKTSALSDVNSVSRLLADYRTYENARLSATVDGLENYAMFNAARTDSPLSSFISQEVLGSSHFTLSSSTIAAYRNVAEQKIENERMNEYSMAVINLRNALDRWDYAEVSRLPREIGILADSISIHLSSLSSRFKFPVIKLVDGIYTCEPSVPGRYLAYAGENPSNSVDRKNFIYKLNLAEDFAGCFTYRTESALVLALLALMYFFYYWIAYPGGRETISRRSKKSDAYGTLL